MPTNEPMMPNIPPSEQPEDKIVFDRSFWRAFNSGFLAESLESDTRTESSVDVVEILENEIKRNPQAIFLLEKIRNLGEEPVVECVNKLIDSQIESVCQSQTIDIPRDQVVNFFKETSEHDPFTAIHLVSFTRLLFELNDRHLDDEKTNVKLNPNELMLLAATHDIGKTVMFNRAKDVIDPSRAEVSDQEAESVAQSLHLKAFLNTFQYAPQPAERQKVLSTHLTIIDPARLLTLTEHYFNSKDRNFTLDERLVLAAGACHHFELDEDNQTVLNDPSSPSYGHKDFAQLYQGAISGNQKFLDALLSLTNETNCLFNKQEIENLGEVEIGRLRDKFLYSVKLSIATDLMSAITEIRPYEKGKKDKEKSRKTIIGAINTKIGIDMEQVAIFPELFEELWDFIQNTHQEIEKAKINYDTKSLKEKDKTQTFDLIRACQKGIIMIQQKRKDLKVLPNIAQKEEKIRFLQCMNEQMSKLLQYIKQVV